MVFRNLMRTMAGSAVLALSLAGISPATAHEGKGDTATNDRGVRVETSGEGKRMSFVANLQYDKTRRGAERLRHRVHAARRPGVRARGHPARRHADHRHHPTRGSPRRVAVYDCEISQGDIQVWRNDGRVLASYTADGTFGEAGAASRCGRDLDLDADDVRHGHRRPDHADAARRR